MASLAEIITVACQDASLRTRNRRIDFHRHTLARSDLPVFAGAPPPPTVRAAELREQGWNGHDHDL